MRQITVKEMQNILKSEGYMALRQKGSHQIWSNGKSTISLPTVELKCVVANRLVKEIAIKKNNI